MVLLYLFILIVSYSNAWYHYNLYNTDQVTNHFSRHCMYQMTMRGKILYDKDHRNIQIIEYCIRPSLKERGIIANGPFSSKSTFSGLKKKNVTVDNLIEWSAPIDLIEQYHSYLETENSFSMEEFYNCTVPWFGPFCQYKFSLNCSFSSIAQFMMTEKKIPPRSFKFSCYAHLKCDRGPSPICLDWREVCDGKVDCFDGGEDEKYCLELEMNQCAENEYQCRNGMCIDQVFLLDDPLMFENSKECLDGTDEPSGPLDKCHLDPTFRCEDTVCSSPLYFTCGDGACSSYPLMSTSSHCWNKRGQMFNIFVDEFNQEVMPFARCFALKICASAIFFGKDCQTLCENREECEIQYHRNCSSSSLFLTFPMWDGHVRLGYFFNRTLDYALSSIIPHIVCYNQYQCPFLTSTLQVDNYTCRHINELNISSHSKLYTAFLSCTHRYQSGNKTHCPESSMMRCPGTNTCISKRRIMNGIPDCYDAFDESSLANSCELNDTYRFSCTSEKKCLSHVLVDDGKKQCLDGEDEFNRHGLVTHFNRISFFHLCNNKVDMVISENQTDETHCERWSCVNEYTRCNRVWNCPKGIDELNCSSNSGCPADHHPCFFPQDKAMSCLHINHTDDGIVDCLGATDERAHCRILYSTLDDRRYRCWNDSKCVDLTEISRQCGEFDKQMIDTNDYPSDKTYSYFLSIYDSAYLTTPYFSPRFSRTFPTTRLLTPIGKHKDARVEQIEGNRCRGDIDNRRLWLCNRGIPIFVGNEQTEQCLCPPSYYGHRCQYQNQRVSLTLRFRKENVAKSDIIGIVVTLLDHTGLIHSHHQLTYIPTYHCYTKFNIYLLYQDQPKDMMKNYTIRVDAFDKWNLQYLENWKLPIRFHFMPVNRVSAQLTVPARRTDVSSHDCCLSHNHTHWMQRRNIDVKPCRCDLDSSETNSTVQHECNCANGSICIGFANNRSICLCPLRKMGPRCFLNSTCHPNICMNGGLCVLQDERSSFTDFICLCQNGFFGERCENKDVIIEISFSDVVIPQSLFLHFIMTRPINLNTFEDIPDQKQVQSIMFKKIPVDQHKVIFNRSFPFHLVFAQIDNTYYLTVLQHEHIPSIAISTQIKPSQRCPHIRELLDEQTASYPILRRAKYYHIPCNETSDLACFHDNDTFMCLCTEERNAHCFHFGFNTTYDCTVSNNCKNEAQCFQDHPSCPTATMCVCKECFYGSQCELNTKSVGLSLDAILGYHIHSRIPITQQSTIVKVSIVVTTLMFIVGLIGGILSILTFLTKSPREVGCGLYLLASSTTSILIIIVLNLKVWLLILSQMSLITSRSYLHFNCRSIDFLLRSLLAIADWFNACVSTERFLTIILDVNFNKMKSKRAAKLVVFVVPLFSIASVLHDPIHRYLTDEDDEGRSWCVVRYTSGVQVFNSFINIFHFIIPFCINLISAIGIIITTARKRSAVKKQVTFSVHLKEQFHHHKHLIFSAAVCVILGLPRLILVFVSGCMTSARDPRLHLVGYFISFIPYLLTFFVFVLPSETYKKELKALIIRRWQAFKRCLNLE